MMYILSFRIQGRSGRIFLNGLHVTNLICTNDLDPINDVHGQREDQLAGHSSMALWAVSELPLGPLIEPAYMTCCHVSLPHWLVAMLGVVVEEPAGRSTTCLATKGIELVQLI